MNIIYQKGIRRFQLGGPVEAPVEEGGAPVEQAPEGAAPEGAEGPAPEGQGQEDPMMQLAQMFSQGLQNQDCQMLAQGAQMFLQLLQQSQGGGGPQGPLTEPVFRRGGVLAYRIWK